MKIKIKVLGREFEGWRCKKRVKKEKTAVTKKCVTAVIFCGIIKLQ